MAIIKRTATQYQFAPTFLKKAIALANAERNKRIRETSNLPREQEEETPPRTEEKMKRKEGKTYK